MISAFVLFAVALSSSAGDQPSRPGGPSAAEAAPLSPPSVETKGVRMLRLYGGQDGETHAEMIELPKVGGEIGKFIQTRLYATDVSVGDSLPGSFVDWHGVSTPRLLVVLSGKLEIGLGDGSRHIMSKGDIVLAADTTGRGHTSRTIGSETVRMMTVALPAQDSLKPKMDACPPGIDRKKCVAARVEGEKKQD